MTYTAHFFVPFASLIPWRKNLLRLNLALIVTTTQDIAT